MYRYMVLRSDRRSVTGVQVFPRPVVRGKMRRPMVAVLVFGGLFYAAGLFCVAASTFAFVQFACLRLIFAHCVDVVTMSLIGVLYIG